MRIIVVENIVQKIRLWDYSLKIKILVQKMSLFDKEFCKFEDQSLVLVMYS